MDLIGFCVADSYRMKPLADYLRTQFKVTLVRDVIGIEIDEVKAAFFFPYGVVVTWGLKLEQAWKFLEDIKGFEHIRCEIIETDEFTYELGVTAKIQDDEITLPQYDLLTKLAISHGIAQSVELANFETVIQNTFNNTRKLPEDLANKGSIKLSRNEIRKKMGELFLERSSINLHVDALDLPEFFWDYPELEPFYQMIANYLDIRARTEVLNHRLDIIHELYEMLATELNHQHSSRLEWTIILLIVIEVALTLLRDVLKVL